MTYNLVFLKFNNYYNRKIKRYETLSEYLNNYVYYIDDAVRVINYNDGINVTITFNKEEEGNTIGYDYIVAINADTENTIESRWFILEERQTRQGQWILSLRRDLVADFYDKFIKSTVYVEKGWITSDTSFIQTMNPLVFNQEGFTANQIKKNETLLRDKLGCKWIVGYLNKGYNDSGEGAEITKSITTHLNTGVMPDYIFESENDISFLREVYKVPRYRAEAIEASFFYECTSSTYAGIYRMHVSKESVRAERVVSSVPVYIKSSIEPRYMYHGLLENNYGSMVEYANTKYRGTFAYDNYNNWLNVLIFDNKVIGVKSETGTKFYRVELQRHPRKITSVGVNKDNDPIWYENLQKYIARYAITVPITSSEIFSLNIQWSEGISVKLIEIESTIYTTTVPVSRNRTSSEAFDAFAIPYVDKGDAIGLHLEFITQINITDYEGALAIAQEICDVSNESLDLQLLPYCPIPDRFVSESSITGSSQMITIVGADVDVWATPIRDVDGNVVNSVFWLQNTSFSTIIEYNDQNNYANVEEIKCINQLDTWRLESGDYSSAFEFNMAKNGGVQYFEVDCKYKPYQPYIHVAPNFGSLYGGDYNDVRGLVCSNTNYSLPRLNDTWESYERNNLNYMNAFNRQIVNMETQRKYQRLQEGVSVAAGSVSGMASGALVGSMIPAIGPFAGAVVGAATSAAAGAADLYVSEQLYKENKQYAIDQFNMSLENIRALPNTLVAVGAQNPNNKVFPVLSFYSCTDIERQAFKQKLRWNGCTVGVITDDPMEYIDLSRDTYFKGQLINIDMSDAAHEASELANELAKGVIFLAGG